MKLYADGQVRRTRQLAGDVFLLLWVVLWVWLGTAVHDATLALAVPGKKIQAAGGDLGDRLREAGSAVGSIPLVGNQASTPFDGAGRAADQIVAAGAAQVDAVQHLAWWLGVLVAAGPILVLAAVYLPLRWRFVQRATRSRRFLDAGADPSAGGGQRLDLFALRALARQPLDRLARVSPDPVRAWRDGDRDVVRALALLELRDAGLSADAVARKP
jgi:hypothetical protein